MPWLEGPPIALQAGDLVVRKGNGAWSKYFIRCSSREKRFSHIGFVATADGADPQIIHADADDASGIGSVRYQPWTGFFDQTSQCAIFRYNGDPDVPRQFIAAAKKRLGVPFDCSFDLSETNRLYCSEFTQLVINETLGTNLVGHTEINGAKVIAIDDVYRHSFKRIYDSHPEEIVPGAND